MPGHHYTAAGLALQRVVESFGNSRFKLAEHRFTHTYAVGFRFCQLENMYYLVVRFLNTGTLPLEEFSKVVYIGDGQWHRFTLNRLEAAALELVAREREALAYGEEVESLPKTRRERVWIGGCT
jgi:hypothetical protein